MRSLILFACILVLHSALRAQDFDSGLRRDQISFYKSVIIVATEQPAAREACTTLSLAAVSPTCATKVGHAHIVHPHAVLAFILTPLRHTYVVPALACLAVGGLIALLFLNPLLLFPVGVVLLVTEVVH